ncbi:hypothetical protein SAMN02799624_02720 [Paenibacillus sp. UNC496MF]|uniref:hypothetical protein n=1 Tax=Paenibacillus sp. UNC496MF TaxID=1502753 RepID=UPI0008DEEBE7|nr:hypothetical protein [Paenibacillus sp. UNC496MF]SFI92811.1 hypothetical protein SAMN02799624_02720 [Paenibacillus sp. UNC496MF]
MTQQQQQRIAVHDGDRAPVLFSPEEMAASAGIVFPLAERVSGAAGDAFDFGAWFARFREREGADPGEPLPTHLKLEAADTFEAVIPWEQLTDAAVQFALDGAPLPKNGPVRLYVPNGSSECLNVKSIVAFRLLRDEARRGEASYGFKRTFSADDMRIKKP